MIYHKKDFCLERIKKRNSILYENLSLWLLVLSFIVASFNMARANCIRSRTSIVENGVSKVVVGYVTSWTREMPSPMYLTHINYAFGHVNKKFNGVRVDNPDRLKAIVALKMQKPSLKVCLSIGGWGSGGFSEMVSNKSSRDSFALDCQAKNKRVCIRWD